MDDFYLGQVILFAGNFVPRNFTYCWGQLLPISQNTALFSLLGTYYGGDGVSTFALPDLRGRVPIGVGTGNGLTPRNIGDKGGVEEVTLVTANLPSHNHQIAALNADGTSETPVGKVLAIGNGAVQIDRDSYPFQSLNYGDNPNSQLAATAVSQTGNNLAHENMQPYLGLNYIICVSGLYPTRD